MTSEYQLKLDFTKQELYRVEAERGRVIRYKVNYHRLANWIYENEGNSILDMIESREISTISDLERAISELGWRLYNSGDICGYDDRTGEILKEDFLVSLKERIEKDIGELEGKAEYEQTQEKIKEVFTEIQETYGGVQDKISKIPEKRRTDTILEIESELAKPTMSFTQLEFLELQLDSELKIVKKTQKKEQRITGIKRVKRLEKIGFLHNILRLFTQETKGSQVAIDVFDKSDKTRKVSTLKRDIYGVYHAGYLKRTRRGFYVLTKKGDSLVGGGL